MKKDISSFLLPAAPEPKPKKSKPKPKPKTKKIQVEEPRILIDPRDFNISPLVDGAGIHILIRYLGQIFGYNHHQGSA